MREGEKPVKAEKEKELELKTEVLAVTLRELREDQKGASQQAYRVSKLPRGEFEAAAREGYIWHAKLPNELTHTPTLHQVSFPEEGEALNLEQLRDQELTCRKSLVAGGILATLLGKENVAKSRVFYGSFDDGQPQYHIASRIDPTWKILKDVTPATNSDLLEDRQAMTTFEGEEIANGQVKGKPLTGFGRMAAIILFIGEPDAHPGNFGLIETEKEIKLGVFDNKFALGSRAEGRFFEEETLDTSTLTYFEDLKESYEGLIERDIPSCEEIFEKEKAAFSKVGTNPSLTEEERLQAKIAYISASDTLGPLVRGGFEAEQFVPVFEKFASYQDNVLPLLKGIPGDFQELIESQQEEVEEAKRKISTGEVNAPLPTITQADEIHEVLKESIFPSQELYKGALSSPYCAFNFPFPDDFSEALHVQEEYFETVYLISHMDKGRLHAMVNAGLGDAFEKEAGLITGQLEKNQEKWRKCMGQCPEYQEYVRMHEGELKEKLQKAQDTLVEKRNEFLTRGIRNVAIQSPEKEQEPEKEMSPKETVTQRGGRTFLHRELEREPDHFQNLVKSWKERTAGTPDKDGRER